MEDTEERGPRIENGSEWSNGTVHFDRTGLTQKVVHLQRWTDSLETFPVGPNRPIQLDRNFRKFWFNGSHPVNKGQGHPTTIFGNISVRKTI